MTNIARSIWPNLKSDERPEQQQRSSNLAEALYPKLVPQQPNPRDAWREWFMHSVGLHKIGGK